MTARIVTGSGQEYRIDRPVMRIGSEPGCHIPVVLPGAGRTLATLRDRDGEFLLYNRAEVPVVLGGRKVTPGDSAVWVAGADLELPGGEVLTLLDGSPDAVASTTPAEAPGPRSGAPAAGAGRGEAAAAKDAPVKNVTETVVTVVCLLVLVIVLFGDPIQFETSYGRADIDRGFQEFMKLYEAAPGNPDLAGLREQVQLAHAAWSRGDEKLALQSYRALRDSLVARMTPGGSYPTELEQALDRLVMMNLHELEEAP